MKKLTITGLLASFVLATGAFAAAASTAKPTMHATPPSTAAPTVSSAELQHFVQAYEAMRPLRMKYMKELMETKDKSKQAKIKQEGMTAMKHTISEYMPVAQYVQVGKAINENPALRKRFVQELKANRAPAGATGG